MKDNFEKDFETAFGITFGESCQSFEKFTKENKIIFKVCGHWTNRILNFYIVKDAKIWCLIYQTPLQAIQPKLKSIRSLKTKVIWDIVNFHL